MAEDSPKWMQDLQEVVEKAHEPIPIIVRDDVITALQPVLLETRRKYSQQVGTTKREPTQAFLEAFHAFQAPDLFNVGEDPTDTLYKVSLTPMAMHVLRDEVASMNGSKEQKAEANIALGIVNKAFQTERIKRQVSKMK